jgi:hypothetical protein
LEDQEDNIKMGLKEIGCVGENYINIAEDRPSDGLL